jgi:hypothetical protein
MKIRTGFAMVVKHRFIDANAGYQARLEAAAEHSDAEAGSRRLHALVETVEKP